MNERTYTSDPLWPIAVVVTIGSAILTIVALVWNASLAGPSPDTYDSAARSVFLTNLTDKVFWLGQNGFIAGAILVGAIRVVHARPAT